MNVQDELVRGSLKTSSAVDSFLGRAINVFLGVILIGAVWVVEFVAVLALARLVAVPTSPDEAFPYLMSYALLHVFIGLSALISVAICFRRSDDLRQTLMVACRWSAPGMVLGLVGWCVRRALAR